MAWKEPPDEAGVPKLVFEHPRVRAAMKVTGIQLSDVTGTGPLSASTSPQVGRSPMSRSDGAKSARGAIADKSLEADKTGASTARSEVLARGRDVLERKRHALLRELEATAEALDDADVEELLSPSHNIGEGAEAELSRKRMQVERMRERIRAQLKREAQRQIDHVTAQAAAAKGREEVEKRLEEVREKAKEELQAKIDKRAADHAKAQARIREGLKELKQKREEVTSKLAEASERVQKMLEDKANGDSTKHMAIRGRLARIAEQRLSHEESMLKKKLDVYKDALAHQGAVAERLEKVRAAELANMEEKRAAFEGKMDKVAKKAVEKERERESTFMESAQKLQETQERGAAKVQEVVVNAQTKREKYNPKFAANKLQLAKERREYVKELKTKLADIGEKADSVRQRHLEETVYVRSQGRGVMKDIVEHNKARLLRSDEISRQQAINKIERERARTELAEEHHRQVHAFRSQVIKESMHGRQHVEELKRLDPGVSDSSTRRVNDILKRLEMAPLPTKPRKEGDEGQQQ